MGKEEVVKKAENTALVMPDSGHEDADMTAISAGDSKFLPRLQLMTSRSEKVEIGEFPVNHFAMIENNNFEDLGESVDVLLVIWRPKALDTKALDGIITSYDPKFVDKVPTGVFADIQKRSAESESGCMYGPEYLVYIPVLKRWATFFCGSKTLRFEVPAFKKRLGGPITLRPILIDTGTYKYYSAKVYDCTTILDNPDQASLDEECKKFKNPPKPETEAVSDDEAKSTGRAQ